MGDERTGWLATAGQIVGNLENWSTEYSWDGSLHDSRGLAISAGFDLYGSDDFNVGRIEHGSLVWFGWMDEKHPVEDYPEVARSLGLEAQP